MKKQILNLGKALNNKEQKEINGGISKTEDTPNCSLGMPWEQTECCIKNPENFYCLNNN
ncbi:hypothetical protein OAT18_02455 [Tenacibaculum sp.]|nr:hypothetical protein [Tenacibaculum sp.]